MFENCSIIIIANGSHVDELYRLEVDADTQKEICLSFDSAVDDLLSEKTKISFDGSYKPHNDEFLAIENFQLSDAIKDAIRDPLGVPAYKKESCLSAFSQRTIYHYKLGKFIFHQRYI